MSKIGFPYALGRRREPAPRAAQGPAVVLLRRIGPLSGVILLLALVLVFIALRSADFLAAENLQGIVKHSVTLSLIAAGLTAIVTTGEFDLSFPALVSLATLLVAGLTSSGVPYGVAVAAAVGVGLLTGVVNGLLVSVLGLASFVATIGTGAALTAGALFYSGGQSLNLPFGSSLQQLAHGSVLGVPAWVPLLVIVLGLCWLLLERSRIGHYLVAVGESPRAAEIAGVDIVRAKIAAFGLGGVFAALGGVFVVADQGAGFVQAGSGFLFDAYAAVFLGAATFRPGQFNLRGTLVGVLILGVLFNGLNLVGLNVWEVKIASGIALLGGLMLSRVAGEVT